jgi:uncharacterized membrane protein
MSRFAVVVFPDEKKASWGARALQELHRNATVTVFGAVVVRRDERGVLSARQRAGELPVGLGVPALVGGLFALFGGRAEAGASVYAREGVVGWRDYLHAGVSDEFLESVVREFVPGTFAVIAEIAEDRVAILDERMGALSGNVVRETREAFVDDLLEKAVNSCRAELTARRAERASATPERTSPELVRAVAEAQENLEWAAADIRERLGHAREELEAKVEALEQQATDAGSALRSRIDRRIAALREEFGEREKRLVRAYQFARSAARPQTAVTGVER